MSRIRVAMKAVIKRLWNHLCKHTYPFLIPRNP